MKSKILPALFSCVVVFAFTGCTTTITRGEPTVVSTGIDQKDWNDAAATMINSLRDNFINSDKLQSPPNKLALLAISRIVNNTDVRVDTDMLVKKIRVDLLNTGKVVTSTTIGGEDPIAEEEQRRARLLGIEPNRPNYTLSGKIIEQVSRAGNTKDKSYVFQLSLTKNPDGFAVWEDEHVMNKRIERGGWRP